MKLKNLGFNHVVLVGNLKRPSISDIKPDFNSAKIIPKFAKILFKGGDNNLLNFCINYLNNIGFNVVDLRKIIPENFLSSGNITKINLSKRIIDDIKKGKKFLIVSLNLILDNHLLFNLEMLLELKQLKEQISL